ncbi:hypothetical protein [Rhizobium mongolense]|uniref:Apea-like HEPN domain-containing protein n=1 Tax=Rhizobium mongolense TaxID=57676 RepID=A0A7W6WII0_9HYPH|nr:hypothetical protein [Rhizobium mongolense]MBB4279351.1 hypothetical protein [Rhizobium mongolense]
MLNALLRQFREGTEITATGLSYRRIDFQELYEILPDAFVVKPAISRTEGVRLFSKAIRDCRISGTLTGDAIATRAAALHKVALAVPKVSFTLWTKFRAQGMPHSPGFKLKWQDIKLRSQAYLPSWLQKDEYLLNGVGRISPRQPEFYGHVILTCSDRDEDRAVDRMLEALQLMLGLLNLYETWEQSSFTSGRNWTEGGLWQGPNQFLFRNREFRGEDRIWYNPDYDLEAWNRHPPQIKRVLQVVPKTRLALAALETHPLKAVLVRAIQLLQEGFATRDGSLRLLRYWSALEQLYVEADAKGRSNEKVLERAVFAELEPELPRWKLEHLARVRNEYVHAGGSGDDLHHLCQFMRKMLARHINYWIFRCADFPDHAALLSFVKLSADRAALAEMRDLIDRRIDLIDQIVASAGPDEVDSEKKDPDKDRAAAEDVVAGNC